MENWIKRAAKLTMKLQHLQSVEHKAIKKELLRQEEQLKAAYRDVEKAQAQLNAAYEEFEKTENALDRDAAELPEEISEFINELLANKLSMTSKLNLTNTAIACINVIENGINGDFVECGVWRGGHSILAAFVFDFYNSGRKIHLYDTFSGMTPATANDVRLFDELPAEKLFEIDQESLCNCSLEQVQKNFDKMNVTKKNVEFVKGDVCFTLLEKQKLPESIAVLRLDTDLYESTKIELEKLYSLVQKYGVVIFDDYGYWAGQKIACDEFFNQMAKNPCLINIGGGSRLMIKCD